MIPGNRSGASSHPGFAPFRRLRDEWLDLPVECWIDRCNRIAEARGLRSAGGAPLRFVLGCNPPGALDYETAIFREGRIACRREGRGMIHDMHNALVWLTFPAVKATLNRLHIDGMHHREKARGRVRDVATLLDESGLLWLSDSPSLDAQLRARDWRSLLVRNRTELARLVRPVLIGHGLLEKLAAPYKSMTAHCLVCSAPEAAAALPDPAPWLEPAGPAAASGAAGSAAAIERGNQEIDAGAAAALAAAFAGGSPPKLAPLPILGLPGWDPANVDQSYYDDARVFRA